MIDLLGSREAVLAGITACALTLLIVTYLLLSPGPVRVSLKRLQPGASSGPGGLTRLTTAATEAIERLLHRRGDVDTHVAVLDAAGLKIRLQDLVLLVVVGSLVAGTGGLLLSGVLLGLALAAATPFAVRVLLSVLAGRRRAAFADQLDDSLQLIASSLRAGHSLLQALASVAHEAEEPTAVEFARIINETRVGRPLAAALDETAARMRSEDFVWVTQAIAINREVGGNLAEVLDGVGHTIRERNQIRRQVQALSAEGKLSAYVLIALPFGIGGFLSFSNPAYMAKFTEGLVGYAMAGTAVVMLVVGALWLRKVVSFKF
ncbi:MAG TPA: type II secretion system F family protein [Propionibacteriaceae bacterium]|jgi:tight adherence protein B